MLKIAIIVGIYSYFIFFLGIFNLLYPHNIILLTIFFLLFILFTLRNKFSFEYVFKYFNLLTKFEKIVIFLIVIEAIVNLIGALGPELSFDALWYHLTLPKIYLQNHSIFYVPGNLFYYSAMPKMADLLYIPSLLFGGEILAKVTHFIFGILCVFVVFNFSKLFTDRKNSLLASLIFYSNLVVAWESTVAYIDLTWTFFSLLSFYYLFRYFKDYKNKNLLLSALMLGFSISTKIISLRDILIFISALIIFLISKKIKLKDLIIHVIEYLMVVLLITSPWFVFSYIYTKNPLFPFFSNLNILGNHHFLEMQTFFHEFYTLFFQASDPISPIYVIIIPLIFYLYKSIKPDVKVLTLFSAGLLAIWYISYQPISEGRFALPYLGIFSTLCVLYISKSKNTVKNLLIAVILSIAIITIIYRGIANAKYIPVVFGYESKSEFLTKHLNFNFGDFYDTDNYFKTHLSQNDIVLIYNIHNLYYANFNFIDSSYLKKSDKFNYILVRGNLPNEYKSWNMVYENKTTNVKLYKLK